MLTVSVIKNFDGLVSGVPPDTCGAAGPNSYIETVNSSVAIYNKSTGATIATDGLAHFFYTTGGITKADANAALSDATMCYDEATGQFIVADLDVDRTGGGAQAPSQVDFAVSKTSNPTALDAANWTFHQLGTTEGTAWSDYPGNIGYNHDALVFTWNMMGTSHTLVDALSQSDLAAGGSVNYTCFDLNGSSYRPVTMHDSAAGGPMWFVQEGDGNNSINLHRIDNILTAPALTTFNIGVNAYNSINAPLNPDRSAITTNIDTRILKAAEANNIIVACQHVGVGTTEDDARWYEFDVSDINNPICMDQGNVSCGNDTYVVYPGIDINAAGDIGMSFILSGNNTSTDFMSVYVTGRNSSDPAGTMETPVLVRAGDSNNRNGREGDFSGINVDPNGTFWIANEFTAGGSSATEVANFTLSNGGEAFVKNGALEVTATNANDHVTLRPNPGNFGQTQVLDNGVDLGDFNNGSFSSLNVSLFGGDDSLTLADAGGGIGLDFFNGVPVTYDGGAGTNAVLLDDSTAPFSDTYTVTSNTVSRPFFGGLTYSNVQNLTLDAESGNDTINVLSTAFGTTTTLNSGTGNDTTNVQATSGPLTIEGQDGNDTVHIGSLAPLLGGTLANITGPVSVANATGTTALSVDDSGDTTGRAFTITNGAIAGTGLPAAINYTAGSSSEVTSVTVDGGSGGNTFNVLSTGSGTSTTLDTGDGNDATNVRATSGPLTVQGQDGTDTVVVGSLAPLLGGTLANITGPVSVANATGTTALSVDDSGDSSPKTAVSITSGSITGLAPAAISYSNLSSLTILGGSGGNTSTVVSLPAPTALKTGAGNDKVNLQATSGSLVVNGQGGTNTLVGPNVAETWSIAGANAGSVGIATFSSIQNLTGGTATDTFKFTTGSVSGKVDGGAGADALDYSGDGGVAATVNLATAAATKTGGFAHIEKLVGSSSTADKLVGPNAATSTIWSITAHNAGTVGGLAFSGIENLTGGTGVDEFVFGAGVGVSGKIDGGSGSDNWLDYAAYTTAVAVDLTPTANTATGVGGGIAHIRNVRGGAGNDTLKGNSQGNILVGGGGADTITGGGGRSILIGGKGNDAVKGGSADDIVIGGYTDYDSSSDTHDQALEAILAEWQSTSDSYSTRIAKIKAGVGSMLAKFVWGTKVHDDGNASTLTGGAGMDWFFKGASDTITDRDPAEQVY
jgi:hypothetical protein